VALDSLLAKVLTAEVDAVLANDTVRVLAVLTICRRKKRLWSAGLCSRIKTAGKIEGGSGRKREQRRRLAQKPGNDRFGKSASVILGTYHEWDSWAWWRGRDHLRAMIAGLWKRVSDRRVETAEGAMRKITEGTLVEARGVCEKKRSLDVLVDFGVLPSSCGLA